jgi:hypothetical protein
MGRCLAHTLAQPLFLSSILHPLVRDAITFFFSNHHIHFHVPLPPHFPSATLLPLPLSAFSAMPHCSRFHKAEAKFNVITECMFFFKYMRIIYDRMFQQSHILGYTQLQSLAISVSQNMHSHTVNPSTRSSTAYFLYMLPVPVETIWLSDC